MVRRAFFSFHYGRDLWRVNQVRQSWVTKPDRETAGYWDASLWERTKTEGDAACKRLIDDGLSRASVTVVLIGYETHQRPWVQYEIEESCRRNKGLLGVYINRLGGRNAERDPQGPNPFAQYRLGDRQRLDKVIPTYHWMANDGYNNLGTWIDEAAARAGR